MINDIPQPQWFDTSHEVHRTYIYPSGAHLKVETPLSLRITVLPAGELHVIKSNTVGESIIVVPGWVAIKIQEAVAAQAAPVAETDKHYDSDGQEFSPESWAALQRLNNRKVKE